MTHKQIVEHADQLTPNDWNLISRNQMTIETLRRFSGDIDWFCVLHYQSLTNEIAKEFELEFECKSIWENGELHCEIGPAVTYEDGTRLFFLNGNLYFSEEDWKKRNENFDPPLKQSNTPKPSIQQQKQTS